MDEVKNQKYERNPVEPPMRFRKETKDTEETVAEMAEHKSVQSKHRTMQCSMTEKNELKMGAEAEERRVEHARIRASANLGEIQRLRRELQDIESRSDMNITIALWKKIGKHSTLKCSMTEKNQLKRGAATKQREVDHERASALIEKEKQEKLGTGADSEMDEVKNQKYERNPVEPPMRFRKETKDTEETVAEMAEHKSVQSKHRTMQCSMTEKNELKMGAEAEERRVEHARIRASANLGEIQRLRRELQDIESRSDMNMTIALWKVIEEDMDSMPNSIWKVVENESNESSKHLDKSETSIFRGVNFDKFCNCVSSQTLEPGTRSMNSVDKSMNGDAEIKMTDDTDVFHMLPNDLNDDRSKGLNATTRFISNDSVEIKINDEISDSRMLTNHHEEEDIRNNFSQTFKSIHTDTNSLDAPDGSLSIAESSKPIGELEAATWEDPSGNNIESGFGARERNIYDKFEDPEYFAKMDDLSTDKYIDSAFAQNITSGSSIDISDIRMNENTAVCLSSVYPNHAVNEVHKTSLRCSPETDNMKFIDNACHEISQKSEKLNNSTSGGPTSVREFKPCDQFSENLEDSFMVMHDRSSIEIMLLNESDIVEERDEGNLHYDAEEGQEMLSRADVIKVMHADVIKMVLKELNQMYSREGSSHEKVRARTNQLQDLSSLWKRTAQGAHGISENLINGVNNGISWLIKMNEDDYFYLKGLSRGRSGGDTESFAAAGVPPVDVYGDREVDLSLDGSLITSPSWASTEASVQSQRLRRGILGAVLSGGVVPTPCPLYGDPCGFVDRKIIDLGKSVEGLIEGNLARSRFPAIRGWGGY